MLDINTDRYYSLSSVRFNTISNTELTFSAILSSLIVIIGTIY